MGKRHFFALPAVLLLVCLAGSVYGFGANGHRVIGEIAEQRLSPAARAEVNLLLDGESLAFASTWADEMRSNPDNPRFWGYDYSANWHFINVPENRRYSPDQASENGDAYTALLAFKAILNNQAIPPGPVRQGLELYFGEPANADPLQLRRFALRFLVHIVQDLHQPLHVGHAADLGGNRIRVNWFGDASNLHTVWDTRLVEFQQLSFTELSRKLEQQIETMPATSMASIESATPLEWIEEGLDLRRDIYAVERYSADLGYNYTFEYVPVMEQQLIKAGLRLAWLLNSLFGR